MFCLFFFFKLRKQKAEAKLWRPKGVGTVVGSLTLGARVQGAEVFLAMQGHQHILTALILGKLSFSNCCIHFVFNVTPFYVSRKINSVLWVV